MADATKSSTAARLVDLVRPRTSLGTSFPDVHVAALRIWMLTRTGPALATAGPGAGLTTLVELLAVETDVDLVCVGSGTPHMKAFLDSAGSSAVSVELRRKVIMVEGADALAATESVAWTDVIAFARSRPRLPVLFTAHSRRSTKPFEFARTWPRFDLGKPSGPAVLDILRRAARAGALRVDDGSLDAIARDARGDVRSALNALEVACKVRGQAPVAPVDCKDVREDGLDVVEAVLTGARGISVDEAARMHEPSMVAMGVFENYLSVARDAGACVNVAEWFSVADAVDARSHGAADPPLGDRALYRLVALAGPAHALAASSGPCSVKKFGSVWSKQFNACTKTHQAKALAVARLERGLAPLDPCDMAFVRAGVLRCMDRGDDDGVRALVEGLSVTDVVAMVKMDPRKPKMPVSWWDRLKRVCAE